MIAMIDGLQISHKRESVRLILPCPPDVDLTTNQPVKLSFLRSSRGYVMSKGGTMTKYHVDKSS